MKILGFVGQISRGNPAGIRGFVCNRAGTLEIGNGTSDGSIASIKIDPQALTPADAQIVEDMILTAVNQALNQAKEISNAEMGRATAGFSLPGMT